MTPADAAVAGAVVHDAFQVGSMSWHDLPGSEGVAYKLLWRSGKSVAGILRVPYGCEVSLHVHRRSHHHLWLLDGSADILGHRLGEGSYAHIPAGVEHGITSPGPHGCSVLYLYLRDETAG
jgi:mannose-6-phosphate isomerase-like protein (cupin superfamily)